MRRDINVMSFLTSSLQGSSTIRIKSDLCSTIHWYVPS
jgi:hypothetical protein